MRHLFNSNVGKQLDHIKMNGGLLMPTTHLPLMKKTTLLWT